MVSAEKGYIMSSIPGAGPVAAGICCGTSAVGKGNGGSERGKVERAGARTAVRIRGLAGMRYESGQ